MDCAFDDDQIIVVAKVDVANFRQCGPLYTQKSIKPIPHDHIPYAIGKTGLMACITICTTKPAASRMVGHAGALVLVDSNDGYVHFLKEKYFRAESRIEPTTFGT